nr:MAG TPA_asm: capsid assembly protein [Caudoviricetes sp.]
MSGEAPTNEPVDTGNIDVQVGAETGTVQMNTDVSNGQSIMAPEGEPDVTTQGEADTNDSSSNDNNPPSDTTLANDVAKHQDTLKALEKDLRNKGVDFKQAIKEYEESGNISSRTLANLVNAGYPKEVVESFIEGRHAIEERFTKAVYDSAGGEQEYFKMTQWAANNLPQSTLKAFNKALDSNDLDLISMMVAGIQSKMDATRGTSNPTLLGSTQGAGGGEPKGFASKQDMIKAMSDPRYARDPAYTRSVEQKMLYTVF